MKNLALTIFIVLATGCHDNGQEGQTDAALDLALPPQVAHVGVNEPVCCVESTPAGWRVMYLASPVPGVPDNRGNDTATQGELHLADAYGADLVLATDVPRAGYIFSPDAQSIIYLAPSTDKDKTYALYVAALPSGTLSTVDPVALIPRGLAPRPLDEQAFFSPDGRFLLVGVTAKTIMYSSDLTVIDVPNQRVLTSLPDGSFDYIELVTSSNLMVFQNSTASKTLGTPSEEGLYVLPLASAGGAAQPSRIDTRTVNFATTADERRIVYTRFDNTMWMYDLGDQSHLQIASGVVAFTLGNDANGPLVWIAQDLSVHVERLLQPELTKTAPNATDVWSQFLFSPSGQDLYFFDLSSVQDNNGDLYRLGLQPSQIGQPPHLIDRRVSQADFRFIGERVRYLRKLDGRGEIGEMVSANLDGSDIVTIAAGVPSGSLHVANPQPVEYKPPPGQPPHGAIDMSTPIIPPVYAHLVSAKRDPQRTKPLFDESLPIVGKLAFSRGDGAPVVIDPSVHVGGFHFSPDGYVLIYAGGTTFDSATAAYLGTLQLFQTLVDQAPVVPVLSGVSEVGAIFDRALFVAAPGAEPPGVYFVRY